MTPDWTSWFDERRAAVDSAIAAHFADLRTPNSRIADAVRYSVVGAGKRLRPILVLESCAACGGDVEAAWPSAIAIECVHAFSLVHDDLPAMDDDDLRRGKPTTHRQFDEATAILAGDWLLNHAFDVLTSDRIDAGQAVRLVRELAAGTAGMIVGQGADMDGQRRPADAALVDFVHVNKTARLFEAACRMGAVSAAAAAARVELLGAFGRRLGLAFQIADDLLDVAGAPAEMGKRAAKDAVAAKQTYPAAHGIDASRARARAELAAALALIEPLGPQGVRLRGLAEFAVDRRR